MDQTKETEPVIDSTLNVSVAAFEDMLKILSALSNEDALSIFLYCKNCIKSSKDAIEALDLTQKRFYSRLKDLIDVGLIEKVGGEYRQTTLGKITHKLGTSMEPLLLNKDRLKLADNLQKIESFSEKEKRELTNIISFNDLMEIDLSDIFSPDQQNKVNIIDSFEDLVSATKEILDKAEENIFMATQYIDARLVDIGFKDVERGIKMKAIMPEMDQFTKVLRILFSMLMNPKQLTTIYNSLNTDNLQIRFFKLPYTFFIADRKTSIIEIKNPITDKFQFAFLIRSEKFSRRLLEVFDSLWEKSSELKNKFKI